MVLIKRITRLLNCLANPWCVCLYLAGSLTASGPLSGGQSGKWVISGRESELIEGTYVQKVFGHKTGFAGLVGDQPRILLFELSLADPGGNNEIQRFGIGGNDDGRNSMFEAFRSKLNGEGGAKYLLFRFDRTSGGIIEFDGATKKFSPGLKLHFTLDEIIRAGVESI